MVFLAKITGPRRPGSEKSLPFECGVDPTGNPRKRFGVKFFLVALLFLIFDVETIFIFPWAVLFRDLGWFGFVEMLVFIGVVAMALVYVWRKGALDWD